MAYDKDARIAEMAALLAAMSPESVKTIAVLALVLCASSERAGVTKDGVLVLSRH
jgi:hypothetical protein